jgi:mannose-1-phosphate guanylyltransferase
VPKEAHTGYGYIKKGEPEAMGFKIEKFEEKPSLLTAESYLDSGDYLWNSGMFMFKASVYLAELERYRPDISAACRNAMDNAQADLDFLRIDQNAFGQCPSDSIDYAVMEETDKSVVVPLDAGWTDIGSWSSLWEISEKDEQGNSIQGDAIVVDAKNSYVRSEDKLVAAIGIDGLVIVNTKDALLVATQNRVQDVKKVTERLKAEARAEWELHREVYRPWGKYDSVDSGERYQVKRITVDPGAKLSVQMHHHRAEHWVVVSGCARVTKGEETFLLSENQSTYIPIGEVHALENPGKVPLEIVEIQSGSYLDEDDIVRLDDRYGR